MSAEAATLARPSLIPPSLRPLAMLVGIAAAVAAGVAIVLWTKEPNYSLLYGNLGQQDAAHDEVVAADLRADARRRGGRCRHLRHRAYALA